MSEKTKKILLWVLWGFCFLATFVYLPSFASVLFLVTAIGCMPVKQANKLWEKIPIKAKAFKPTVIAVMFIVACLIAPGTMEPDGGSTTPVPDYTVSESTYDSTEKDEEKDTVSSSEKESITDTEETVTGTEETESKDETESSEENVESSEPTETPSAETTDTVFDFSSIPAYSGDAYVAVNNNVPFFTSADMAGAKTSYESYSDLDAKGRCGVCVASVGQDIMPTEERGEIGSVKPSGWNQAKYAGVVDGNYLYNRCHLIGYQLTGENANTKNLITGTRYMNVDGMLPFENMVADYVKETGNHVLYRVTPIFENENLLASGVLMEAKSVEDDGEDVLFCVYCYNVQPGITIDYSNGASSLTDGAIQETNTTASTAEQTTQAQEQQSQEAQQPTQEPAQETPSNTGNYAVNAKNGKIHIVGGCAATGTGSNAMDNPVYFSTYEEAESYSSQIAPKLDKRKCGNCW